jgi:hypothetical protein
MTASGCRKARPSPNPAGRAPSSSIHSKKNAKTRLSIKSTPGKGVAVTISFKKPAEGEA